MATLKMKNKKTTIVGYLTIGIAVATVARSFLMGEPINMEEIMLALGIGGAGLGALNAQDGSL